MHQFRKVEAIGLTFQLSLSRFLGWLGTTCLAVLRLLLIEPAPCLSEDRRMRREMTRRVWKRICYTTTSDWFQKTVTNVAFWLLLVALVGFAYFWASWECALGNSCFLASADFANWVFK